MKTVSCGHCGTHLVSDEIALNQRLLGQQIGTFLCMGCLAARMEVPESRLWTLANRFKAMGCIYFTRLTEENANGTPDEHL